MAAYDGTTQYANTHGALLCSDTRYVIRVYRNMNMCFFFSYSLHDVFIYIKKSIFFVLMSLLFSLWVTQRNRCCHWAVKALLGSSNRTDRHLNRHPAALHASAQCLACFPPPVLLPNPGCGLLSSLVPAIYPLLLTVKRYGSGPCQPLCPSCSVVCQTISHS